MVDALYSKQGVCHSIFYEPINSKGYIKQLDMVFNRQGRLELLFTEWAVLKVELILRTFIVRSIYLN